jgi:RIP metalloprotease RseP
VGGVVIIVGVLLMVVVHEAAHFIAAKAFGMKATEAFFGFGPRLWSVQRGETEYGVKAIPLGGYVRIIGMNPFEEVAPEDEGRTYRENPFWKKAVVVLAGIFSHFVVAFILFLVVAASYGVAKLTNEVSAVSVVFANPSGVDDEVPLELFRGDDIVAIDGQPIAEWTPVPKEAGELTEVEVLRDGEIVTLTTTERLIPAPAATVDVRPGDVIVGFAGEEVDEWDDFRLLAEENPGREVTMVLDRDGEIHEVKLTLATRTVDGEAQGFVGLSSVTVIDDVGILGGVGVAATNVGRATVAAAQGLGGLVVNFGDLVGAVFANDADTLDEVRPVSPIGLVRIAGPIELSLQLLAFVNVFVGVLNVVPLYPLDGGHFAVALYEKIRGREADVRRLLPIAAAVFVFIVLLGLLGFYFDIVDPLQFPE